MGGYIKYFKNSGKVMSLVVKNDDVLHKYNAIWYRIKETLSIKFHSMPHYDDKYIKTKVREFNGVIKTNFLGNEIPKESMHCITCITIDSVRRIKKKNNLQVYLEECNYNTKKKKMTKFIKNELESDSDSESELESDVE